MLGEGGIEVTGHAHMGNGIAAVRRKSDLKDGVRLHMEVFAGGGARHGLGIQDHNAVMRAAQADLVFRADHAFRRFAAELGFLDSKRLVALIERSSDGGHHHFLAGIHIGRTAHNVKRLVCAHIHRGDMEVVGIRMRLASEYFANDQSFQSTAHLLESFKALDLKTAIGQKIARLRCWQIKSQEFF